MYVALFYAGLGLFLLYAGAEALVRGSSSLGLRLGLSPLVVGLTIVAFGTSAPELAVSVNAALAGQTDLSVGNVIGSNIANIGLILGLSALVRPINIDIKVIRSDIPIMLGASILLCLLLLDTRLSEIDGVLLVSGIAAFTSFNVIAATRARRAAQIRAETAVSTLGNGLLLELVAVIAGLSVLAIGGKFLVDGAVEIARIAGVSEAVIGLTIVAVGTSMPELATSLVAAAKKLDDISLGNIVGSNIFNILGVLGVSALITPLPLGNVTWIDIGVMMFFTLAVLPLAGSGFVLKRWEGMLFFGCYGGYLVWLVLVA